jgi:hypothetical protein
MWAYLQLHGRKETAKEAKYKMKNDHSDGIYGIELPEQSCCRYEIEIQN